MGRCIRGLEWERTPLGPLESWPQSLRTAVGLALSSQFPITLAWGPSRIQIYNDGYRQFCGAKHPRSMGQDFRVCWESCWPEVGEPFARAFAGVSTYLENQRMFLDRYGYLEETFFTYSYSPIHDETGEVAGMFCPVTETTPRMLSERRTRILRDLAAHASAAQTPEATLIAIAAGLEEASFDLPFVLIYLIEAEHARLVAKAGLPICALTEAHPIWPLREVVETAKPVQVDDIATHTVGIGVGPYPEPVATALALPLNVAGAERPVGVLIAGVSARLRLNDAYRAFYDLLAAGIAREYSAAVAYQQERQRVEALQELDRAKTDFFSNVSHEFRTPLTLMLGPLEDELNERGQPLPVERHARLESAHRNAVRLLKLVNSLLDVSRIEAGRIHAHYEPLELASYTSELAGVFRSAIEHAGLVLTVDCPPLPERVYVDREMWEKIVMNLISNAFKHTFEGGIGVSLRWCEGHVELAVRDSGVGIAAAELPHLFERFHRIRHARARSFEGTGIGLSLVRELAAAHGGTVAVESRADHGATFRVRLRTGKAHLLPEQVRESSGELLPSRQIAAYVEEALHWVSADAHVPPRAPDAPRAENSQRPRILLADDNADMREYLTRLLDACYDVHAVSNGQLALDLAQESPPDLVLSDIMMPELDGFGLLRALRAARRTQALPIILLSARAGEEAAIEGLSAGADDYLVKPFSARELLARVRTHLDMAERRREWARELERANRELESFSYSVAHDLRVPLRAIDGFSRRLLVRQHEHLDEASKTDLARIGLGAARMSRLIDDLLGLARISRRPLRRRRVELDQLVQRVFEELQPRGSERRAELEVQAGLRTDADPRLLRVVLENLLSNALKFSQRRSDAHVSVGRLGRPGPATFYVADNGAGFDMRYAGKLFEPFARLHSRHDFEGTGVGLATVQRIVARHGGRIWAESQPGAGATFYFTLHGGA